MPSPIPPPQLDLRQRFGAMRNLPPFLREIWASSPWLTTASLALRLVRALMPVATLYVGKLMVIKSDNVWYAAYEIFLSVDPENITDWDRNNVLAYTAMALDTMEEMVDYITEIANGESADNVFAMWQADIGAV